MSGFLNMLKGMFGKDAPTTAADAGMDEAALRALDAEFESDSSDSNLGYSSDDEAPRAANWMESLPAMDLTHLYRPARARVGGGAAKPDVEDLRFDAGVPNDDGGIEAMVQANIIQTIKDNIPLAWHQNGCWMDTQLVSLLFDRTSPYFKFLQNELLGFFVALGKDNALDSKTEKVKIMAHLDAVNATYFHDEPLDRRYVPNTTAATGEFEKRITLRKLRPFLYTEYETFTFLCHCQPFLVRQFDAHNAPPETLTLSALGKERSYGIKSISGLRGGHWQTLVRVSGKQYFKVNVSVGGGVDVVPYEYARFVREFGQCRAFYLARESGCDPTDPQSVRVCDAAYKALLVRTITAIGQGTGMAPILELLDMLRPNLAEMPLDMLFNIFRKKLAGNVHLDKFEVYLRATNRLHASARHQ